VFRPSGSKSDVQQKLAEINQTGLVYLTPGNWFGTPCIRAAFSNWRTEKADVDIVCSVL